MNYFNKLFISIFVGTLLLISTAGIVSASNLPYISEDSPIICYPLDSTNRTYAVSAENRYIEPGDECHITAISGDHVYVDYPTPSGRHGETFEREMFTTANIAIGNHPTITAIRKITTYRNALGDDRLGYLEEGDLCYILTKTHGRTQLIYQVPTGYKMGWVDSSEIYDGANAMILSIHSALDTNKVIDVDSGSHMDGTNILLYSEHGGLNQRFELIPIDNYFVIVNTDSGKALDVQSDVSGSEVNVQLYTVNYSDSQLWEAIDTGEPKKYYLRNKLGYFLSVCGGSTSDCTNIEVNDEKNSDEQKFLFKSLVETNAENNNLEENISEEKLIEKNIPDGIYTLSSALSTIHGIDVCDASIDSGANVQIWELYADSKAQTFSIVRDSDGWYSIWNVNSAKVLDVQDANNAPGANIQQWENFNSDNQKFKFYAAGNGFYYIKSKIGNFLQVADVSAKNGSNLQLYSFNSSDSQKFKLHIQMREGICTISSALDDNVKLDIENANEENGTNIQLWSGNANAANTYLIWRYKDTSHFFIEKLGTNKELDVKDAKALPETNVQLWDCNYDTNQRWEFIDAGDGYYYIKSALGDLYLDAQGGSSINGTNIQVYPKNGGTNQKWRIDYLDYSNEITSAVDKNVSADFNEFWWRANSLPVTIAQFAELVGKEKKYDIKTKDSWGSFFENIAWITNDGIIKYNNMLITPEQLGNMLYAHFGKIWHFDCSLLLYGGDVAATIDDHTFGDDPSDRAYIELGYYHFKG